MRFLVKAGGLLLILALPVLIYIFLQAFGENKYDLPVYYRNGVDTLLTGCHFSGVGQYTIPFQYFDTPSGEPSHEITIAFFKPSGVGVPDAVVAGMARTLNVFKENDVNLLLLSMSGQANFEQLLEKAIAYGNDSSQWSLLTANKGRLDSIACAFVIAEPGTGGEIGFPLVLIDRKRRIRGYYQAEEREEIDRLVVEINILLENDKD